MPNNVLITQGTSTPIAADLVGSLNYQTVKLDVGIAGASVPFTGTLSGGTVDSISQLPPNYFNISASTGTTALGTIKAAVAGSAIFITDLIISTGSATNVVIGMGGTSTPFLGTLSFAQYGGLVSNFRSPGSITLGSALVYQQSVGCSLSVTCIGFVR